ncbi:MAG: RagB/SusD family nutrient uptake outer membrane protein [Flavobacteriaceae bacterium]|nr:RagB/SusD family nutrient uptake outer membrane protein [Flavobacteriaceae bacterium]
MKNLIFKAASKKQISRFRSLFVTTTLVLCSASCSDFVEVPLPNSQLTGTTVFESNLTANAAMAQVYIQLRDGGILTGLATGSSVNMGLYADELQDYTTSTVSQPIYNNALTEDNATVLTLWRNSYSQIYNVNSILAGLSNATQLSETVRSQLRGESLFVRALVHFYLMQIYGNIPYITSTDYMVNSQVTRQSSTVVYNAITTDLQEAIALLSEEYVSSDKARPNKIAARALLARVYLYRGLNEEAANEASAVINSPLYTWENNLNNVFLRNSTTTIWQFASATSVRNSNEGATFIFVSGPPPLCALRQDFINSFEIGDQRKLLWTKSVTSGGNTWYHAFKYKLRTATSASQEYSVVLRLAEQYLIRAEARAKQGDLIGAKNDIDKIRTTAGLPATTATTETQLLAEIQKQRRFELFTEYGHRFFDLKRSGTTDAVLSTAKPGWNTTDVLWPIPETELNANPNLLPQNPGY